MKVFVTGHKGYIGVHLVDLLKQAGHTVTGCDIALFEGCEWESIVPADRDLVMDVRDVTVKHLAGHDCVMHLAAISNDPMGEVDTASPTPLIVMHRFGSLDWRKRLVCRVTYSPRVARSTGQGRSLISMKMTL